MAFCPHCGKSVTEQATKCAACGGELEQRGKGVRFKGTMMMSPGTAPLIQPPNAGQRNTAPAQQPVATPAAPPPSASTPPSPTAATMPMPAVGPIADAAAAAMAGKKPAALKATMLGTGEAGLEGIAKNLQAQAQAARAAAAATAPAGPPPEKPAAMPAAAAPQPAATTRREVEAEDDSKRFLVGDPMGPKGGESPAAPQAAKPQRAAPAPRFSDEMPAELPKDRSATFIIVGIVGVCVIAAIGYIAAKLMGLTN